ncbi:hypothetical protein LCGC14_1126770 [marine sediment metagenome]|uniref:Uncharacterized protein n=1 Tax=marine sediment metagenome TaxID=412755 RepID=A0A0F9M734_9ZZZZ
MKNLTECGKMILEDLTEKEKHLIEEIRKIPFGWLKVIMIDGQPKRIEEPIKVTLL